MRVFQINTNPKLYSSNVYLVLGNWSTITDKNVLIDTGIDDYILAPLSKIYTGVGKKTVDKVVLTHSHFDHIGGLKAIVETYNPEILGVGKMEYSTRNLHDKETIRMGEGLFTVYAMPGHSFDSIVLLNEKHGLLFTGDTNFDIKDDDGEYYESFRKCFEEIVEIGASVIYPGHGLPIFDGVNSQLARSLKQLNNSSIINDSVKEKAFSIV